MLNLLGVDFASSTVAIDFDAESVDGTIRALSGTYVHTLLEWSATTVAAFTALLAFTHFRLKRDIVTPIIGVALPRMENDGRRRASARSFEEGSLPGSIAPMVSDPVSTAGVEPPQPVRLERKIIETS